MHLCVAHTSVTVAVTNALKHAWMHMHAQHHLHGTYMHANRVDIIYFNERPQPKISGVF